MGEQLRKLGAEPDDDGRYSSTGLLLTTSCLLVTVLLFVVIALSVSVGELSIPLQNVFYTVSNKIGLTDVPSTASTRA